MSQHKQARLAGAIVDAAKIAGQRQQLQQQAAQLEAAANQNLGRQSAYAEMDLPEGLTPQQALETDHDGLKTEVDRLLGE